PRAIATASVGALFTLIACSSDPNPQPDPEPTGAEVLKKEPAKVSIEGTGCSTYCPAGTSRYGSGSCVPDGPSCLGSFQCCTGTIDLQGHCNYGQVLTFSCGGGSQ